MKLLSANQVHAWDAFTMQHEPVASIDLMERAARACTDFLLHHNADMYNVKIFCGKGNNGGDGLAIARQLAEEGVTPTVYILEFGAPGTQDFQTNLQRLHQSGIHIHFIQADDFFPQIDAAADIVIDALFGAGLNRPLQGLSEALVHHINDAHANVIAIDVPSGMYIDQSSKGCVVVKADHTLTFQSLKLCFIVAENASLTGKVHVLDIGLDKSFPNTVEAPVLTDSNLVKNIYRPRTDFMHKGNNGHALLIAGSLGKTGAAIMGAHACLRTGAGLVTIQTNQHTWNAIHAALPEAMCISTDTSADLGGYQVVGIGPGIGKEQSSAHILKHVLTDYHNHVVLDADAINILSENREWYKYLTAKYILTPHPKEFERLAGKAENDFERINRAVAFSKQHNCIVVLKGHYTMITHAGNIYFNTTGNAGLAKGGSGDVLTGMITALLAQGYEPADAAIMGVYLHGLAADIATKQIAVESLLAGDVISHISDAILTLSLENDAQDFVEME